MKKYILFLLIVNIACKAQNKHLMEPEINNKFEKFDVHYYNKIYNKELLFAYEKLQNGSYIKMDKDSTYCWSGMTLKDSYYRITKIYYPNGNIKKKGLSANTGNFQKGVWYEFDEKGDLIKETDYDQPFTFTFEDILKFCEKHGIKIDIGPILPNTGWHTRIFRRIENDQPFWEIEYKERPDLVKIIKLDGITGKVLGTRTYDFINN